MIDKLGLIQLTVAKAKQYPDKSKVLIEYNFDELPDFPGIEEDNFLGVPSQFNKGRQKNTLNIVYKVF